jgi:hypothetical protein
MGPRSVTTRKPALVRARYGDDPLPQVGSLADGARREPRRTAVAKRPTRIHASPKVTAKALGLICVSQTVEAKSHSKGWCQISGGYVQSSHLRFIRVREGYEDAYDYKAPLAIRP